MIPTKGTAMRPNCEFCGRRAEVCEKDPCTAVPLSARLFRNREIDDYTAPPEQCEHCGRLIEDCNSDPCRSRISHARQSLAGLDSGAVWIPDSAPEHTLEFIAAPTIIPQPYPLYATCRTPAVMAANMLVLAWRFSGEDGDKREMLVAGVTGPEWIDVASWEVSFSPNEPQRPIHP